MGNGNRMDEVAGYLNYRSEDLMIFKMPKNQSLMDEIFAFDPRNIESISSAKISEYTIGLAQFLIYFSSQINRTKVSLMQKNRYLDLKVIQSDIKGRTKIERREKVIDNDPKLQKIEVDIIAFECELKMTENLEKYYVEFINALKRELTRRETELKFTRDDRSL